MLSIYFNVEKLLCNLSLGQSGVIAKINQLNFGELLHWAHLGLVQGQPVKVLCLAPGGKAMLIDVRGCAFAIDCDICKKIVVEVD